MEPTIKQGKKRLAVYSFYDKDGIVDDYIIYMLKDLLSNSSELLVVCNGKLTPKSREKLEKLTPHVFVRENKGFDAWAYKSGMDYFGWDKLAALDEIILLNSALMGPLYPLRNMFADMDARDADFWGITTFPKLDYDPYRKCRYGYIPLHIQFHFIVIRKHMLQSVEFKKYWDKLPVISSSEEAFCWHEAVFTKVFEEKGFTWQAYVDTSDMEKFVINPIMMDPVELLKNRRCPVFMKRSFYYNYHELLDISVGNASMDLFEYIKNHSDYDVNMIWDNILRTQNQSDIKNSLHLNYLLPSDVRINQTKHPPHGKIALVMHLYFLDLLQYCFNYAKSMPRESDVYITTNTNEKKREILKVFKNLACHHLDVRVIENRGRDVSALLVSARDFIMKYDYVCFVHDKKVAHLDWGITGSSFSYQCFENLLKNPVFVENIIEAFERNPRLGLLIPPPPGYSSYYFTIGYGWGINYQNTKKLADELKLSVPISPDKDPIAPLGTMFWFRPKALKILFDRGWEYSDFPKEPTSNDGTMMHAIERVYPLATQQAGYYPAWLMVDTFAKLEVTNLYFMLSELNKKAFQIYGFNSHYGLISAMQDRYLNDSFTMTRFIKKSGRYIKGIIKQIIPTDYWYGLRKIYRAFRQR